MRFGDAMASDWPMQTICTSLQTDTHMGTQTPHLSIFAGRMPFLMPNQQCQSTEGNYAFIKLNNKFIRLISGSLDQRQCIHLVLDRHLSNRHHLPVGRWMEVGPSGQLLTTECKRKLVESSMLLWDPRLGFLRLLQLSSDPSLTSKI